MINNEQTLERLNLKSNLKFQISKFGFIVILLFSACTDKNSSHEHDSYTCPMHPTVVADKPGTCPVCGMDLVLKGRESDETKITDDVAKLLKSPNETVIASIKTMRATYKSFPMKIEAQGIVTYDTRTMHTIPTRVGGRLENVFLTYPFQSITKGQKVAEIYSPELITAQRELLYLLESDAANTEMIQSAKSKLQLIGVSPTQIQTLIKGKETLNTFTIYSPYTGYLIVADQQSPSINTPENNGASSASDGMDVMSNSPSSQSAAQVQTTGSSIKEGTYVSTGQTLFKIINPASLRIEINLPATQAGYLKKGEKINLDFGNGKEENATIDFIQPFFNADEAFVKIRVYTDKVNELHIGHLITASIELQSSKSLWIVKEAVMDLGLHQIVFIKEHGVLKPKNITSGIKAEGLIEVKSGLTSADEIASNAQFLVDSESFVKPN